MTKEKDPEKKPEVRFIPLIITIAAGIIIWFIGARRTASESVAFIRDICGDDYRLHIQAFADGIDRHIRPGGHGSHRNAVN